MVIDWTNLIIAVIGLVITYFLIPYLKQKLTGEQLDNIGKWLRIFCSDAEVIFNGSNQGSAKKAWVLEQMNKLGFKISEEQLDAYLEAIVKELKALEVI